MEDNPWREFRIFIGIGIVLWIVWFLTGGVARYDETKPYVERPIGPGEVVPVSGPGYLPGSLID